jgi:hypothetical protein
MFCLPVTIFPFLGSLSAFVRYVQLCPLPQSVLLIACGPSLNANRHKGKENHVSNSPGQEIVACDHAPLSYDRFDQVLLASHHTSAQWWHFGCPPSASAERLDTSCHTGAASSLCRGRFCTHLSRSWFRRQASGRTFRLCGILYCTVVGSGPNASSRMSSASAQSSTWPKGLWVVIRVSVASIRDGKGSVALASPTDDNLGGN